MAYIGNSPGVASQRITTTFTATAGQTTFTPTSGYTVGYIDVFVNGVKLINGDDFTASNGTTVVLTAAASADDVVETVAFLPRGLSDGYTKAEADARYMSASATTLPSQTNNAGKFLTTDGTNASWATVTMPDEIRDPVNSSPANGSGGQMETPTLTSSAFRSLYGETHSKSQWQVSTASDFSTTVVSTGDSDSLTSYTIPSGVLSTSTTYYWRVRYKDSNGTYSDWSTATTFITASSFTYAVEYLVVAGGGGGAGVEGGGGGAGGLLQSSATVGVQTSYSITVGLGGTGNINPGGNGGNSSISLINVTAIGGGGGGAVNNNNARSGGSGGGGGRTSSVTCFGGAGTAGQGNAGGTSPTTYGYPTSGGGGAGAVGQNGVAFGSGTPSGNGGAGGAGLQYSAWASATSTGDSGYYAGGGGGGGGNNNGNPTNGAGGIGGGGAGGREGSSGTGAVAGQNGTGGGGGGGGQANFGSNGGSGIVIIRYSGSQRGTGGTVTSSGGYTYHTFTSSGTFTA